MQVGEPSIYARERLAGWRYEDVRNLRSLFLPGAVMKSSAGDIPAILAAAVVRTGPREAVKLQFQQATRNAHLKPSRQLEKLRAKHPIRKFGMLVTASRPFGELLGKVRRRGDSPLVSVRIQFWVQVAGRSRPVKLAPIAAHLYGRQRRGEIRLGKLRGGSGFGLAMFCPEWWCLDPTCHSHWYWFPGVPATTVCGGRCLVGGPCQCWMSGRPSGWASACAGLKLCWC